MTDPTNAPPPEGQQPVGPEAPAAPDYGAPPEVIQEALSVYRDLNNLDTRHQRLSQIVRPDIDGQFLRSLGEPQQQEDPYAQFYGEQQPQYQQEQYEPQYEPEVPQFDPRQFADVVGSQVEQRIMAQLGQMAQEQAVRDAASSAVQQAGVPADFAEMIEVQVKSQMQLQPNRMPGDLAREAAERLKSTISSWAAQPAENPAPTTPPPSGPAPSLDQRPKDFDDMARYAQERLR
jgi:hypothetical protein